MTNNSLPGNVDSPYLYEDTPIFHTRAQLKRHQAAVHNAQYQDRKDHPEMYPDTSVRDAVVSTVMGFSKALAV